jgi:hypothetical protein
MMVHEEEAGTQQEGRGDEKPRMILKPTVRSLVPYQQGTGNTDKK